MKFLALATLALAARQAPARRMNAAQLKADLGSKSEAGQCDDMDDYYGTTDTYGDGCDWYYGNESLCGDYDHDEGAGFYADLDCCACGGGW